MHVRRLQMMLIGVVIVFLVCQMPQALQHTFVVFLSPDITHRVNYAGIIGLGMVSAYFHSNALPLSFFLYVVLAKQH